MNAEQRAWRTAALAVACGVARCAAAVGEPCRNVATGEPLARLPAHLPRLVAAGVDLTPPRPAWSPTAALDTEDATSDAP